MYNKLNKKGNFLFFKELNKKIGIFGLEDKHTWTAKKQLKNAKYGWYRYDVRFALPVYEENILVRYNIFHARLLINHAENGKKYLYDILAVKKETSKP